MSPFKPFFPFTHQEEPLVLLLTQEMVLPTLFPFMKVTPFPMPLKETIWPEETLLTGWLNYFPKLEELSPLVLKEKLSETSKKNSVTLLKILKLKWLNMIAQVLIIKYILFLMEILLKLLIKDLDAPKLFSNHH